MSSRQEWKRIKQRGPVVWKGAQRQYKYAEARNLDGDINLLPALYYFGGDYLISAFTPIGNRKQHAFEVSIVDEDEMSYEVTYEELEDPLHWPREAEWEEKR